MASTDSGAGSPKRRRSGDNSPSGDGSQTQWPSPLVVGRSTIRWPSEERMVEAEGVDREVPEPESEDDLSPARKRRRSPSPGNERPAKRQSLEEVNAFADALSQAL